jgi:hypothetical protein
MVAVKMPVMRKLHKDYRMQADSLEEIRRGLDRIAFEYDGPKVGSRSVSEGHVINAALLTLMAMPEDRRKRALDEAFAKMNALMALDEPEPEQVRAIIEGSKGEDPADEARSGGEESLAPNETDLGSGAKRRVIRGRALGKKADGA